MRRLLSSVGLLAAFASSACGASDDASAPSPDAAADSLVVREDSSTTADAATDTALAPETSYDVTPGDTAGLSDREKQLVDMPADTFLKVPVGYRAKCDDTGEWRLVMGCEGLLAAWSSGVYDPLHHQMLLFGGGHNDYGGNEVYAFDMKTFAWSRLTEPSKGPYDKDPLDDGRPVSRHTYDGLAWIDHTASMMAWGGSRATSGAGTGVTWLFDPAAKSWKTVAMTGGSAGAYDHSLVYDPVTKKVLEKGGEAFNVIDLAAGTWKPVRDFGYPPYWPRFSGGHPRGTLDTKRRIAWFVGGGLYMLYAIDTDEFVADK